MLARALGHARLSIVWERLWPALASIATAIGLFLALSWLGLWVFLPPLGQPGKVAQAGGAQHGLKARFNEIVLVSADLDPGTDLDEARQRLEGL